MNLTLGVIIFTFHSIIGIIFARLFKNRWFIIIGILLNAVVIAFAFLLSLSVEISKT